MKKIGIFVLLIAGFFVVERLCHKATDGFALNKIVYPLDEELADQPEPFSVEHKHAKDILSKHTFYYLASGAQCYAFVSDDHQYILKLFKFQHMRVPPWSRSLPLPSVLEGYRAEKLAKKRAAIAELFNSFQIAYRYLREETGMLFLHLQKTDNFRCTITIVDKIGKTHKLPFDQTYFALQRHASLAYNKIGEWMKQGHIIKAREGIQSLVHLASMRCKKGVFDKDPDFQTNFGFVDGKAIQIDVGRFSKNRHPCEKAFCNAEIIRITREFRKWLKEHHEALVEVLDEEINQAMINHDIKNA